MGKASTDDGGVGVGIVELETLLRHRVIKLVASRCVLNSRAESGATSAKSYFGESLVTSKKYLSRFCCGFCSPTSLAPLAATLARISASNAGGAFSSTSSVWFSMEM